MVGDEWLATRVVGEVGSRLVLMVEVGLPAALPGSDTEYYSRIENASHPWANTTCNVIASATEWCKVASVGWSCCPFRSDPPHRPQIAVARRNDTLVKNDRSQSRRRRIV